MTFAERLRSLRNKKGWSQYQLEKESRVARPIIHRLESGQRGVANMSVGVAKRLARALGVSLDHLVGMYDDEDEEEVACSL